MSAAIFTIGRLSGLVACIPETMGKTTFLDLIYRFPSTDIFQHFVGLAGMPPVIPTTI